MNWPRAAGLVALLALLSRDRRSVGTSTWILVAGGVRWRWRP